MKISHLLVITTAMVFLAGCSGKVSTSTQTSVESESTAPASENMMQPSPADNGTQADINAESDTVLQAPTLKSDDDVKSIEADLNSTTVVNEQFN